MNGRRGVGHTQKLVHRSAGDDGAVDGAGQLARLDADPRATAAGFLSGTGTSGGDGQGAREEQPPRCCGHGRVGDARERETETEARDGRVENSRQTRTGQHDGQVRDDRENRLTAMYCQVRIQVSRTKTVIIIITVEIGRLDPAPRYLYWLCDSGFRRRRAVAPVVEFVDPGPRK